MPEIMRRVEAVRKFRMQSKKAATVRQAEIPSLFAEIRQTRQRLSPCPAGYHQNTENTFPLGFFTGEVIVNNLASIVPDATLYHFGVLTSAMHMAWMRQVCGRLKSDYRYSNNLVYNNFPWPEAPSPMQIERVEKPRNESWTSAPNLPIRHSPISTIPTPCRSNSSTPTAHWTPPSISATARQPSRRNWNG